MVDLHTPAFDHHVRTLSARSIGGWRDQLTSRLRSALPVLCGVLLVAMVAWPVINRRETSFILSKQGIENNSDALRMERPSYRGRDSQGRAFVITADHAVQKDAKAQVVELVGLEALLTLTEGQAQLRAERGVFDLKREQLRISGAISVERADGYTFTTQDAVLDLPSRVATGTRGVTGQTPIGRFYAQAFRVNAETGLVTFTGGVRMRITPQR